VPRPQNSKIARKKITTKQYKFLIETLAKKEEKITQKKNRTVKLELNKLKNIKAVITILAHTGLRIGETQKITIKQIKEAITDRTFSILQSKNSKARNVNISKEGVEDFKKTFGNMLNEEYNNYIIRKFNKPKEHLNRDYIQQIVNKFITDTLGDRYSSHGFRRNLIVELIAYGGTKFAQKIVGHSDIRTTNIYDDQITDSEAQRALDAIWNR